MPTGARQGRLPHRPREGARPQRQQPLDERQQWHQQRPGIGGVGVDRADLLAHVAAKDPVTYGGRLPLPQHTGMLDGEVADAATCVDRLRRHERASRATRQASGARAATRANRLINR